MIRPTAFAVLLAGFTAVPAFAHGDGSFAPVREGGISWEVLGETEAEEWVDEAGVNRLAPRFAADVEPLDGKVVTVSGYAMPGDGPQTRFSLYASAVDCQFHVLPGPNLRMEIEAEQPVEATALALTFRGTLELVRARKGGVFYRLHNAEIVPPPA
jgi:uncharacterized protein